MKYGIQEVNKNPQWFLCKAMAEDAFKQCDNCVLIIGNDEEYLPYSFRRDGKEISEADHAQEKGFYDGNFQVLVIDAEGKEIFSCHYDSRSIAGDVMEAVCSTLRDAGTGRTPYMIDLDLQLETFA